MVIDQMLTTGQETKDNLGQPDSTRTPIFKRTKEKIFIEQNSTIVLVTPINDSFILGHPTLSLLGIAKLGSRIGSESIVRVVNPNRTFRDYFRDNEFTDSSNTATVDTTNFRVTM